MNTQTALNYVSYLLVNDSSADSESCLFGETPNFFLNALQKPEYDENPTC